MTVIVKMLSGYV